MEACGGAHDLARRLREHGQPVKLLVAADVRPFVRGQKNDYNDAQAIAEAAVRPTVRTVAIKTIEQQDIQLLHRMRQRLVAQRTALINQARAMLLESGLTAVRGRKTIARKLPEMLALETAQLSAARRVMLATSYDSWRQAQDQAHQIDAQLKEVARADARCRRLLAIPGIGVLTATALVAAVGNAAGHQQARQYLPAVAVHTRRPIRARASETRSTFVGGVAQRARLPHAPEQGDRGRGQQAGASVLGGAAQRCRVPAHGNEPRTDFLRCKRRVTDDGGNAHCATRTLWSMQ
jgi:transposase